MAKTVFRCIDGHCGGNPVRVIAGGAPELEGAGIREKRQHFIREFDWIRKGLMFEPRGHDMMSGSIFYPPEHSGNDAAILFIETSGCLPMCGHGTIGSVTIALQEGLISPRNPGEVRLETPAGKVVAYYKMSGDHVASVKFLNVPSFLYASSLTVNCTGLGELFFDVAYGGNFYAIIDPQENFKGIAEHTASELILWSREIRRTINTSYAGRFVHPVDKNINTLSHIQWTGPPTQPGATAKNAVFYGENAIDRSPCGTGTSARMAQWHAGGKLQPGEEFVHESYIGSLFTGRIEGLTTVGGMPAIIPSIEGSARVFGHNSISIDDEDPHAYGFQVI